MSHARVEEVSDSDPDEMDISEYAPPLRAGEVLAPMSNIPSGGLSFSSQQAKHPPAMPTPAMPQMPQYPSEPMLQPTMRVPAEQQRDLERTKKWQCLYPIYFDKKRSREEGRRVNKEKTVANPLAREIVDAVQDLGLNVVFEPGKIHPKDWANPGRVRVQLKEDGKPVSRNVKNKHHLYNLISEHLMANPTQVETPLRLRIQGLPPPKGAPPAPAIPRGWKMNTIVPLHSPAASGGGVSEDFFKDMMAEMGGGSPAALPGSGNASGSEGGKPKKEKKKKK